MGGMAREAEAETPVLALKFLSVKDLTCVQLGTPLSGNSFDVCKWGKVEIWISLKGSVLTLN